MQITALSFWLPSWVGGRATRSRSLPLIRRHGPFLTVSPHVTHSTPYKVHSVVRCPLQSASELVPCTWIRRCCSCMAAPVQRSHKNAISTRMDQRGAMEYSSVSLRSRHSSEQAHFEC